MNKINLVWAVIWTIVAVFCFVGIFWNPSLYLALASCVFMAAMFWHDYRKNKGL